MTEKTTQSSRQERAQRVAGIVPSAAASQQIRGRQRGATVVRGGGRNFEKVGLESELGPAGAYPRGRRKKLPVPEESPSRPTSCRVSDDELGSWIRWEWAQRRGSAPPARGHVDERRTSAGRKGTLRRPAALSPRSSQRGRTELRWPTVQCAIPPRKYKDGQFRERV